LTEMTSVAQDFANAIQVDHLTNEELKTLEEILKDFK